jgi:glycosyltransferase involved in cell wall biosynthesis
VASRALTVSVVVPTRNRPEHIVQCVCSILANRGFQNLIVIDQSDDCATQEKLAHIHDRRLEYVRMHARGVTRARNLGIEASDSDIIAFTDDDCRVPPDWIDRIVDIFESDPRAAVVCGRVVVPPEIQHLGYAAKFDCKQRELQNRFPVLVNEWGITANLSVRRSILATVGPFDPMLGSGAPLRSGGEPDFLFRVLRAGFKIVNAREVIIDHLGVRRPGPEWTNQMSDYGKGMAAALFKHVRAGDPVGLAVYLRNLGTTAGAVSRNVLKGRRPLGARYLLAFVAGTLGSLRFRVDRHRRLYVER